MKNVKLNLMYDGTDFFGSQKNKNLRTVEGVLQETIYKIFKQDVKIYFASRTDRGVHALGQIANFFVDTKIPIENIKKILNDKLPNDLRILKSEEVDEFFISRNSKGKIYFYIINNLSSEPHPIINRYSLWFPYKIDIERLNENIKIFVGKKDFSSFTTEEERKLKDTVREIYDIKVIQRSNFLYLFFYGRSFLRHQIRRMVGAILEIERKNLKSEILIEALNVKKHPIGEKKIKSNGLYLYKVLY